MRNTFGTLALAVGMGAILFIYLAMAYVTQTADTIARSL